MCTGHLELKNNRLPNLNLLYALICSTPSNPKQNCMENHPKKLQMEMQRLGSPTFGLKLSVRMGSYGVLTPQLQAKSWRAKPLNFQKIFFGVVLHTILLGIRGVTKFFWSIDPL